MPPPRRRRLLPKAALKRAEKAPAAIRIPPSCVPLVILAPAWDSRAVPVTKAQPRARRPEQERPVAARPQRLARARARRPKGLRSLRSHAELRAGDRLAAN